MQHKNSPGLKGTIIKGCLQQSVGLLTCLYWLPHAPAQNGDSAMEQNVLSSLFPVPLTHCGFSQVLLCLGAPVLDFKYHHCLLWTNRIDVNWTHLHIQDLPWTPKDIWPMGDSWWETSGILNREQQPGHGRGRNQIKQLEEFGSPGCRSSLGRYKKQVWYKTRSSQLCSVAAPQQWCPCPL